jgi:tetratricopeptide (TPR) repeat protein
MTIETTAAAAPNARDVQLDTLEAKGLIRLAATRPELEYLFRHWLVQDAAYGSLLKQERRDLHARVGEALEALYPERRSELSPMLALHFEQAGETAKAIEYFLEAGQYGRKRNAIREAFESFQKASELLAAQPDAGDETTRRQRVEAGIGRAEAGYSFLAPEDMFASLEAILPEAEALGDLKLLARVHLLIALGRLQTGADGDDPQVKRSLDRIDEIGRELGDPSLRAAPMALIGLSQVFAGSPTEGVAALEESVPLLEQSGESIGAAFARGALAIGYATLGEFDKAEEASRHATEIAAKGDLIAQLDALIAESIVQSFRGDLAKAVPTAKLCVDRAEETGATACVVASAWVLGDAFDRLGRFGEAREILQRGTDIAHVVDRKVWRPTLQAWLGSTLVALGEAGESDWEEALATARSIHNLSGEAGILAKRGEAAARNGKFEAAFADFEAAVRLYEAQGARPAMARALEAWGRSLLAAGRVDDARTGLRRALALLEEMGLESEATTVRGLIDAGGALSGVVKLSEPPAD